MAVTEHPNRSTSATSGTVGAPPDRNPLYSILIGVTALLVLLQGLWAGIFLEHDGKRDDADAALALHSAGAGLAVLLALAATVVVYRSLRHRQDLVTGTVALAVLLLLEYGLGMLVSSGKDVWTAVHVPLAMALMGLLVWLPLRAARR